LPPFHFYFEEGRMRGSTCWAALAGCVLALAVPAARATVFINEIDYDQPPGFDTAEYIELAGTAGTNLSGWTVEALNGTVTPSTPAVFQSFPLPNFTFTDETGTGWGFFVLGRSVVPNNDWDLGGDSLIQNGPNDGIRLLNGATIVQVLSYDGSIGGETEAIPGVLVDDNTSTGTSLYKIGTGSGTGDLTWAFGGGTPGTLNPGETLVPEPGSLSLLAGAALLLRRGRRA
jgi:hypothetical protein